MTDTPNTPKLSSSYFTNLTFTVSMGANEHEFKGDIFAKMSKKCASLLRQGITRKVILKKYDDETFSAFISACQLQPFKVTPKNAFELLELSVDWGIPSLQKFAEDYIKSKNLKKEERLDPVTILADKYEFKEYISQDDIDNVAHDINAALQEEKFKNLPPEVIFQVLLAADQHEIEPQLLIDLTMDLFDKKPSYGVPLIFRDNFELLEPEQRKTIIISEKMHDQVVGYFTAWSLSSFRNGSKEKTGELKTRVQVKIAELMDAMNKARKINKETIENSHRQVILDLKQQVSDQEDELKELLNDVEPFQEELNDKDNRRREELNTLREGVDAVKAAGEDPDLLGLGQEEKTQELIKLHIDELREQLDDRLKEIGDTSNKECDRLQRELEDMLQDPTQRIQSIEDRFKEYKETVAELSETVTSVRSCLTAKIVRDKLRCDEFVRDNDRRFEIFDQTSTKWDLTSDQVKESEEMIEDLEKGLNNICPIRGNAQISPPQSPRASARQSPKSVGGRKTGTSAAAAGTSDGFSGTGRLTEEEEELDEEFLGEEDEEEEGFSMTSNE